VRVLHLYLGEEFTGKLDLIYEQGKLRLESAYRHWFIFKSQVVSQISSFSVSQSVKAKVSVLTFQSGSLQYFSVRTANKGGLAHSKLLIVPSLLCVLG
jgi:hypothetical protein